MEIRILKIVPKNFGINFNLPGKEFPTIGALASEMPDGFIKFFTLGPGKRSVEFKPGVTIDLAPFPGTLAVGIDPNDPSPRKGGVKDDPMAPVSTLRPWKNGSNMDLNELQAGSTLYVPVFLKGGLVSEHIKQLLVGSILTVTSREVAALAALYAGIGALHWLIRRPLLEISLDPEGSRQRGRATRAWDFVFYTSFGLVVTSSVRLAGVLLVFSYLIVPAVVGALLASTVAARLLVGWGFALIVSILGLLASWIWDLPTGAAIVTTFGALLAAVALVGAIRTRVRDVRGRGFQALRGTGVAVGGFLLLAGVLILVFPRMDHLWLDWLEDSLPAIRLAFLDVEDREADAESRQSIDEGLAELARARRIQQDAQWGTKPLTDEMQERVRQYIAGRAELVTGDRLVLRELKQRARERQRYGLGVPLVVAGAALAALAVRRRNGLNRATSGAR